MSAETLDVILNSSILTLIFGVATKAGRDIYKVWLSRKKKDNYLDRIRSIANVYAIMEKMRLFKGVDRVFLLEVSNGGDKPKVGSVLFARAVEMKISEDVSRSSRDSLLRKYDEVRLDEAYIYMCAKIQEDGMYRFKTEDERDCLLKNYYESEGVTYSKIFHIYTDTESEKMFIMSVSTFDKSSQFESDKLKNMIQSEVNEIRDYFRKYRQ